MLNFSRTLERNARDWPDHPAYEFAGESVSNRSALERVSAIRAALSEQGVGRGDVVALLLRNCPEFLELVFALNALGAIWLPLNFRLSLEEWSYITGHAGAKLIVTESAYHAAAAELRDTLPNLARAWTISEDAPSGFSSYSRQLALHADAPRGGFAAVGADDVQRLMYTSGTTSRPKGVPITYGNLLFKNVAHLLEFGLNRDDRVLLTGPMCHVGAMDLPASGVIYAGGTAIILPGFDATAVFEAIEHSRVSIVWLPPAMVNALLAHGGAGSYDLTSLRLIVSGGEKMPEPLVTRIQETFPGTWFADAYGLTETVSGDTVLDRPSVLSKLGSVGRPVPHLDLRILDEDCQTVATGESGEIALRGPKVFSGYWRDPGATAAAIRDGWFHTGDVGRVDDEGYLYIEDRKKDLIISGGENVASPEVERVLYEHPGVLEAAVIGMPHPRWGEVPMAVVVKREGAEVSDREITAFCSTKLAKFKVPQRIEFVDALPRTSSGKVLKRTLRESLVPAPEAS